LVLESFRFEHQPAVEALALIEPLLSRRGTLSFDREQNTIVVRDHAGVIGTLRPILEEFDHQPRWIHLEIYLLRAGREEVSEPSPRSPQATRDSRPLPADIVASLGHLLTFRHYEPLGSAQFVVREGQEVVGKLGAVHEVNFRAGTVLMDQRLRLRAFELARTDRTGAAGTVFRPADLNLKNDKALLLTVSADSQSESGMVVALRWRSVGRVSPPVPENR
jgi:hypothetical protein